MSRPIVSIAVLEAVFQESNKGTLDLLLPFVANLATEVKLAQLGPDDVESLCVAFEHAYGLRLPYHVMTHVIRKAQRVGLVTLSADGTHYAPVAERVAALGFEEKYRQSLVRWEAVIKAFRAYCDELGHALSDVQADVGFLGFLKSHDDDVLLAAGARSVLPQFEADSEHVFLANLFVTSLTEESDSPTLEFITELAFGHALASTIMNWNLVDFVGHLNGLYVYIDTPLLLQLLGVSIPARVNAAHELVELLQSRGAILCVFDHVIEESVDILNGAKGWVGDPGFKPELAGATGLFVIDNDWTALDVEACIAGVDQKLADLGIHRVAPPQAMTLVEYNVDVKQLTDRIIDEYKRRVRSFHYHDKQWTIERDVWSVTAIHRLRKGRRSAHLGTARHIFMTPNVGLALASRHFEELDGGFAPRTIPACMTEQLVATIAWVESPSAGKHMNTRRVMAQAVAAVQPSPALMTRLYSDLRARKESGALDDTEYLALVSDPLARELLAQNTFNDANRYDALTTSEIIEEYRVRYEKRAEAQLEAERIAHEGTKGTLESYDERHQLLAGTISTGVGIVVSVAGIVILVVSAWKSAFLWAGIGIVLGAVGGSVWGLSKAARGWVYNRVLEVLAPDQPTAG